MASGSSAQYIHTVQHLIEKCITFNMSKEECMEALSKHANIQPVITSTAFLSEATESTGYFLFDTNTIILVWKELEKENKEFFEAYTKNREEKAAELTEITQRLQKIQLDSSEKDSNDG